MITYYPTTKGLSEAQVDLFLEGVRVIATLWGTTLTGSPSSTSVVFDDDKGFFTIETYSGYLWIGKAYTRPQFRRQGVMRGLLKWFIESYPKHVLKLDVAPNNDAMIAVLTELGWKPSHVVYVMEPRQS